MTIQACGVDLIVEHHFSHPQRVRLNCQYPDRQTAQAPPPLRQVGVVLHGDLVAERDAVVGGQDRMDRHCDRAVSSHRVGADGAAAVEVLIHTTTKLPGKPVTLVPVE